MRQRSFAAMIAPQRMSQRGPSIERVILAVFVGCLFVCLVLLVREGLDYYRLSYTERLYSSDRALFGTTGVLGLMCGAIALCLFLSNFGYLMRKHARPLERVGTLRLWLDWHIFSAFLGSSFVILHSNFTIRNWIARAIVYALIVVVITGMMGRYLLRFVPRTATGGRLDEEGFESEIMELVDQVRERVLHDPAAVRAMQGLVDELEVDEQPASLAHIRERLTDCKRYAATLEAALRASGSQGGRAEARALGKKLSRLGMQAAVIHWAGWAMDAWRAFHRTFALLLLVGMIAHVAIALYYGYGAFWQ